jgi:hypothetical protein
MALTIQIVAKQRRRVRQADESVVAKWIVSSAPSG